MSLIRHGHSKSCQNIMGLISPRNARRLARKNKDIIHGSDSKQMGRKGKEKESNRNSARI